MFECLSCGAIHKEPVLTRDQAIKRIRDIRQHKEVSHLTHSDPGHFKRIETFFPCKELMAIFDIKEEEI